MREEQGRQEECRVLLKIPRAFLDINAAVNRFGGWRWAGERDLWDVDRRVWSSWYCLWTKKGLDDARVHDWIY